VIDAVAPPVPGPPAGARVCGAVSLSSAATDVQPPG